MKNLFLERNCLISANKLYRWSLSYEISKSTKEIIFIGLNPSLSDEVFLDNTTKKIFKVLDSIPCFLLFNLFSKQILYLVVSIV